MMNLGNVENPVSLCQELGGGKGTTEVSSSNIQAVGSLLCSPPSIVTTDFSSRLAQPGGDSFRHICWTAGYSGAHCTPRYLGG